MRFIARNDHERKLLQIAQEQEGYFTAKQALSAGYSYRLQHYHRNQGHWQEIDRGVFRLAEYPSSSQEDLIRWSLWSRNREDIPQAIVSHETALSVHELSDVMPGKVHLTVPEGFRKKPAGGCVLHRAQFKPEEVEQRQGFFVTTPLRTIVDVAEGNLGLDQLEKALRDGFARGLLNLQDIQRAEFSKKAKEKIRIILDEIKKNPIL